MSKIGPVPAGIAYQHDEGSMTILPEGIFRGLMTPLAISTTLVLIHFVKKTEKICTNL